LGYGKKKYVRVALKTETYLLLREVMDLAVRLHGGKRLLLGERITEDLLIRNGLELLREELLKQLEVRGNE